jgi:ankyrin repeat protein
MSRDIPWLPEQPDRLSFASFFGVAWLAKILLKDTANPNRLDEDRSLGTPLVLAAENESYSCMEELLRHGADPNFQEKQGWTALHWTAANGQLRAAGLLLAMGANVLLKDSRGYDAEHYAAKSGNWGIVSLLRRKV